MPVYHKLGQRCDASCSGTGAKAPLRVLREIKNSRLMDRLLSSKYVAHSKGYLNKVSFKLCHNHDKCPIILLL